MAIQLLGGGGRAAGMLLGAEALPVGSWQAQLTQEVGHGSKHVPCGNKPFSVLSRDKPQSSPTPEGQEALLKLRPLKLLFTCQDCPCPVPGKHAL